MAKNDNEDRAEFMARHQLTAAAWNEDGDLISATRNASPAPRPVQAAQQPGPAAKLANAFAERVKRDHEVRFAASHFKPRFEAPQIHDDVPRAVRAKSASSGRASSK